MPYSYTLNLPVEKMENYTFYIVIMGIIFMDADWAGSKEDRRSTLGYCMFVEENLVS